MKKLFLFLIFLSLGTIAFAQTDSAVLSRTVTSLQLYTGGKPAEKVHLHLDRSWYSPGDTIWFKAYAVAGGEHTSSEISKVLYAELIDDKAIIIKRLNLQLNPGISWGEFVLPNTYKSSTYRIRAYTNWMRNDSTSFFDQKISIGSMAPKALQPVGKANTLTSSKQSTTTQTPDIQFFPEGGYLVNGLRSKVAIKAVGPSGLGTAVQGVIIDGDNTEVASFTTQHAGMGVFALTPQAGKSYKAKITSNDGSTFTVAIPTAKDEGFVLTINSTSDDNIHLKISVNDVLYKKLQNTSFYLIGQSGGKVYYTTTAKLAGPVFTATIAKNRFPTGIAQFTLFSQTGEPLNERLVFLQNTDQLMLILNTTKQSYTAGEKIKIDLQAKKTDTAAVTGSFSVAVTDEDKVPVDEAFESSILTDLLLTSELKGYIENPNYYFTNKGETVSTDLDMLMLTQGYRRFEWKIILAGARPKITYRPETALSLSGTVTTPGNKAVPNGKIQLSSPKDFFVSDTLTDANGNFTFNNVDLPDSTKIIINAKKLSGGKNVKIKMLENRFPDVAKNTDPDTYAIENVPELVKNVMQQIYVAGQKAIRLDSANKAIQLKEVKINGKRNEYFNPKFSDNINASSNLNGPGHADQVILGEKFLAIGGMLSDVLPNKIPGLTWRGKIPYNLRDVAKFGGARPMLVIVEGMIQDASVLESIAVDDVYSIEVLTSGGYLSIYGSNIPNGALVITLLRGARKMDLSRITVDGLITYVFNGFYKSRTFYSPKYNSTNTYQLSAQRKTIYWNPNVVTDTKGKSSFEYFNGERGNYRVVIEGIDGDGKLGRTVYKYKVE
ncbi:MAG: TonB-dependent receptor [Mucilaginibacter sp.]|nr:TonB-dependent receptor [Mucilaginibacter sp.]